MFPCIHCFVHFYTKNSTWLVTDPRHIMTVVNEVMFGAHGLFWHKACNVKVRKHLATTYSSIPVRLMFYRFKQDMKIHLIGKISLPRLIEK